MSRSARAALLAAWAPACCASTVYSSFQTDVWQHFPGYSGLFNGPGIAGGLEISAGSTADSLVMTGSLSNLPLGVGNPLCVHEGFDTVDAAMVGGRFFPGLSDDPWKLVNYTGPAASVNVTVAGVAWRKTLGRVVVVYDSFGAPVALAKIVPKAAVGDWVYSTSLSTYPAYTSLIASIGDYPGSSQGTSGTVWVTQKAGGGLSLTYSLSGLEPTDVSGGIHIHTGFGEAVCDNHANVGGHFWTPASSVDPWNTDYNKTAGNTSATGTVDVLPTGYELGGNEYHALVVHKQDGTRIGCGILHSNAKASIGAYPGFSALSPAVAGTIWVAQGDTSSDEIVLGYKLLNLPLGETSGGLHFHTGKTCAAAGDVGGHFWTPETSPDPWNTTWTKPSGTAVATGRLTVRSGYSLAQNADHALVVHDNSGARIGCGTLEYYPTARGYVVLTGALTLTGSLGGVMAEAGASGGVHVHEGSSCDDVTGATSPGGHLLNTDGSDPWSTTYAVGGTVGTPKGGQDYGSTFRHSGEASVWVSAAGDRQNLAVASGRTVVVHSANGVRIACGVIQGRRIQALTPAPAPAPTAKPRLKPQTLIVGGAGRPAPAGLLRAALALVLPAALARTTAAC